MPPKKNQFDISNRLFAIIVLFVVGIGVFWGSQVYATWKNTSGDYPREISVEGQGTGYVTPDIAKVTLGVYTEGETSEGVVEENTEKMNAVMEVLTEAGIAQEDIRTTSYYLNPKYEWTEDEGSYQDGYYLDQTVEVKIRDFEQIGNVLSGTTTAGTNMIGGVQFDVDDVEKAKDDAREQAIAKATAKAEVIADQAGLKLGKVINYYEYSGGYYEPYYRDFAVAESAVSSYAEFDVAVDNAVIPLSLGEPVSPSPSIEPGQQEVNLTVTLTYRLK